MKYLALILSFTLLLVSCQETEKKNKSAKLTEVASSEDQWTGITISDENRIFVNYPRWTPDLSHSVAELKDDQSVLFPNESWNSWDSAMDPAEHFICVQSVWIDDNNDLWVLDPANPMFQGVVKGGAKLLKFDIHTNELKQRIVFDSAAVKPNSYLNDVRIDEDRQFAYITDSNDGAIIVVNLVNGKARRLLDNHFSTEPELPLVINGKPWTNANGAINLIASDGIALDAADQYLYYHSLNGLSLYRIDTKYLRDTTYAQDNLSQYVQFVTRTGATDGMIAGTHDEIYHTNVEQHAIVRYSQNGTVETVVKDDQIKWPDTFAFGPKGDLYFTTSQIHLSDPAQPYKIFKVKMK